MKYLVMFLVFLFIFNNSLAKEIKNKIPLTKEEMCFLMYQTHNTCKETAKNGKFFKNKNSCHLFSMKLAFLMFEKFRYNPQLAQLSEVLGNVCYASCIDDNTLYKEIQQNCK